MDTKGVGGAGVGGAKKTDETQKESLAERVGTKLFYGKEVTWQAGDITWSKIVSTAWGMQDVTWGEFWSILTDQDKISERILSIFQGKITDSETKYKEELAEAANEVQQRKSTIDEKVNRALQDPGLGPITKANLKVAKEDMHNFVKVWTYRNLIHFEKIMDEEMQKGRAIQTRENEHRPKSEMLATLNNLSKELKTKINSIPRAHYEQINLPAEKKIFIDKAPMISRRINDAIKLLNNTDIPDNQVVRKDIASFLETITYDIQRLPSID